MAPLFTPPTIFVVSNHVARWGSIQYNFFSKIYMKPRRGKMLLFLTTNMAAVTSRANKQ